ncbi:hypothetical protein [Micromonospora aurantiaca (nom. illeg.)]|uniref:hypothetical protein n=1 Tax=Micromonospora aurantiaca (nom. illeg.) TaxID=47850 RepID=UPI003EBD9FA2
MGRRSCVRLVVDGLQCPSWRAAGSLADVVGRHGEAAGGQRGEQLLVAVVRSSPLLFGGGSQVAVALLGEFGPAGEVGVLTLGGRAGGVEVGLEGVGASLGLLDATGEDLGPGPRRGAVPDGGTQLGLRAIEAPPGRRRGRRPPRSSAHGALPAGGPGRGRPRPALR